MGDFLGFTFGGVHSSDLGITRVSGGDRYDEELHPEIKDRTAEVPGLNGQYYFGSDFGSKTFDLEIAFDSLREDQFRKLRQIFGTKEIKELIFDERPYKKYMVKIGSPIELSYICFDEPKKIVGAARDGVRRITRVEEETVIDEETQEPVIDEETGEPVTQPVTYRDVEQVTPYEILDTTERIYKGEGKISFTAYFPFAKSVYKQLPIGDEESSWAISSGILSVDDYNTNQIDEFVDNQIKLYNAGDVETPCKIYCPFDSNNAINSLQILYYATNNDNGITGIKLSNVVRSNASNDIGILINTETGLIQGVTNLESLTMSPYLYNKYISGGSFFKIQPTSSYEDGARLVIEGVDSGIQIFYDYLYY